MSSLSHSDKAEDILHLFYGVEIMVYVEGEDDVPFWEIVFNQASDLSVEIQPVGGSNELKKYIKKVSNGDFRAVIACDSDFEIFKNSKESKNIIRTYGYSIENTIISEDTIQKVIRTTGKVSSRQITLEEISVWMHEFFSNVEELIYYDLINDLKCYGVSVVGDNCSRFMRAKNAPDVCNEKVSFFIKDVGFSILEAEKADVDIKVSAMSRSLFDFIRGHFLFSAVYRFISEKIKVYASKNVSVSNDALFGSLMIAFENLFNQEHPEYRYYKSSIEKVSLSFYD